MPSDAFILGMIRTLFSGISKLSPIFMTFDMIPNLQPQYLLDTIVRTCAEVRSNNNLKPKGPPQPKQHANGAVGGGQGAKGDGKKGGKGGKGKGKISDVDGQGWSHIGAGVGGAEWNWAAGSDWGTAAEAVSGWPPAAAQWSSQAEAATLP